MKINKQLFEDVLSGKLKGTFVLRNKSTLHSSNLRKIAGTKYQYVLCSNSYTSEGMLISNNKTHPLNIEDFIPEINMKENELTIEIPDGKIVDWDESKKQNKIVLKDKQLTYKDVCRKLFLGYGWFFTDAEGGIHHTLGGDAYSCANNSAAKHQFECILAKNKLANVAKYLNDGWKPNKGDFVFCLTHWEYLSVGMYHFENYGNQIIFKNREVAQQAVEILGEETIKLALESLGI